MDLKKLEYKSWTKQEIDRFLEDSWVESIEAKDIHRIVSGFPEVALTMETENNEEGDLIIVIRGQKD